MYRAVGLHQKLKTVAAYQLHPHGRFLAQQQLSCEASCNTPGRAMVFAQCANVRVQPPARTGSSFGASVRQSALANSTSACPPLLQQSCKVYPCCRKKKSSRAVRRKRDTPRLMRGTIARKGNGEFCSGVLLWVEVGCGCRCGWVKGGMQQGRGGHELQVTRGPPATYVLRSREATFIGRGHGRGQRPAPDHAHGPQQARWPASAQAWVCRPQAACQDSGCQAKCNI